MTQTHHLLEGDVVFIEPPPRVILIVDDSDFWRRLMREQVNACDSRATVLEARDGQEALDMLRSREIDIVFLDLELPNINGDDIVRSFSASRRMPFFVVVSGVATGTDIAELRRLLAYDVLEKPIAQDAVARVLKTHDYTSRRRSMLIVDDSRTICNLVRRVVERSVFRFEVGETTDGVSAVELYARMRHDMLVIDLNMPGLHGVDLLRVLRACCPGFRAIVMSGDRAQLERLEADDVVGRLAKPFSPADLDAILHRAFNLPLPYAALSSC